MSSAEKNCRGRNWRQGTLTAILLGVVLGLPAHLLQAKPSLSEPARPTSNDGLISHQVHADDGHVLHLWEHGSAGGGTGFSSSADRPAQTPTRVSDRSPIILLLHGRTWSTRPDFHLQTDEGHSLMDALAEAGIHTFGLDQRGYGATPRDSSGWLTPDRSASDIAQVSRWLRLEFPERPLWLLGWSYGAMQAQLTAQRHGDLFAGIVLYAYPVRPGIANDVLNVDQPPRLATTAAAARSDFIIPNSISEPAIAAFVAQALEADPVRADWRELDQWNALDGSKLGLPTLLIHGEHDPLARPSVHQQLFASLQGVHRQWSVLPQGDHAAHLETPRLTFVNTVVTFVRASSEQPVKAEHLTREATSEPPSHTRLDVAWRRPPRPR